MRSETKEFLSDEKLEEGFLTAHLNKNLAKAMQGKSSTSEETKPKYGRKLTDFVSAPKFGGYFIGKYEYTDKDGAHGGSGFSQRLIRLYIDGTILKHFAYRVQLQVSNSNCHVKDFFLEWQRYKEFRIKVGQFKRAFTFENPMNPWDVGVGDYSQLTRKLSGMGDYNGEANMGGRDQGIQIQGDLFPSKKDEHRFLHYQLAVYNGQGINTGDADGKKDFIGTLQVQPIKNLFVGIFGWVGTYVSEGVSVDRNRYGFSIKYDWNDYTIRAEYVHSQGHKISEYTKSTDSFSGTGKADAWYATIGIPCTSWLKVYAKYDAYRDQATWGSLTTIYSLAPNFQIHKNLMLQVQYNRVCDRNAARNYNELWGELYVRF